MLITKEIEIDCGHRVMNHKSKCKSIHGHRYRIEVGVDDKVIQTKGTSDEGMVIDFGDLKTIMMEQLDAKFDHGFVISSEDEFIPIFRELLETKQQKIIIVDFVPTAENLAKFWYEILEKSLNDRRIKIHHVKIWETPTSTATYSVDN